MVTSCQWLALPITSFALWHLPSNEVFQRVNGHVSLNLQPTFSVLGPKFLLYFLKCNLHNFTGAQPKAGTGHKMEAVRFFNVTLLGIYR